MSRSCRFFIQQGTGFDKTVRSIRLETIRVHRYVDVTRRPVPTFVTRPVHLAVIKGGDIAPQEPSFPTSLASRENKDGPSLVSLFSGIGGTALGLEQAGFKQRLAVDFDDYRIELHRHNMPDVPVLRANVRNVTAETILSMIDLDVGELDCLEGSPPCALFSMAGRDRLAEDKMGRPVAYSARHMERLDDLFFEFARLVDELEPKTFLAENVVGLTLGAARRILAQIISSLASCGRGYRIRASILNAANFGVPQARTRLFIVGIRSDIDVEWKWPKPSTRQQFAGPLLLWLGVEKEAVTPRQLTDIELCLLSGLPLNFYIGDGSYSSKFDAIARVVCPPVAKALGDQLMRVVDD